MTRICMAFPVYAAGAKASSTAVVATEFVTDKLPEMVTEPADTVMSDDDFRPEDIAMPDCTRRIEKEACPLDLTCRQGLKTKAKALRFF